MDPNDPGQAPGAPPPYGAPPASPYGAPPPPPYGAPTASPYGEPPPPPFGTPPPTWGVPDSPYGAPPPTWGVPASAAPARKSPRRRLIAAVIAIVVVVVIGAVVLAVLGGDYGKVQFSKTAYDQSKTTCHIDNAITTANAGDTIYMIAAFKDTLAAGQRFTLTVTKDGQKFGDSSPASLPTEFNCYIEQTGINLPDPGVYKFTFTKDGTTEAEGTLTVK